MAGKILFANNATTTLASGISNSSTTVNLAAGTGSLFPNPTGGDYFKMTFKDIATGLLDEIVHVTGVSGDTFTIVRGQENTTPQAWNFGDTAANLWTAGSAAAMAQFVTYQPARVVTTSGVFTMTSEDEAIGLNRTSSLGLSSTTLPSDAQNGQAFEISDLAANFSAYPVTVNPPSGATIAGLSSVTLNTNRQTAVFKWYADAETYSVSLF